MEYKEKCLHPEQPCASAMDDVEGVIKFMHEMLSDIFDVKDVKQFLDAQSKILQNLKNKLTQSWSSAIKLEERCEIV